MDAPKILIVEDEIVIADNLKTALEMKGYNVIDIVTNGEDAIISADQNLPDCILMDILLKGEMDGITAVEVIKSKHKIPVIYLTAFSDEDTLNRLTKTDPDALLLKPYKIEDLYTKIEHSLYKYKINNL